MALATAAMWTPRSTDCCPALAMSKLNVSQESILIVSRISIVCVRVERQRQQHSKQCECGERWADQRDYCYCNDLNVFDINASDFHSFHLQIESVQLSGGFRDRFIFRCHLERFRRHDIHVIERKISNLYGIIRLDDECSPSIYSSPSPMACNHSLYTEHAVLSKWIQHRMKCARRRKEALGAVAGYLELFGEIKWIETLAIAMNERAMSQRPFCGVCWMNIE